MRTELKQKIDFLIDQHPVLLFMKGSRERPQCGFSKQVVEVLNHLVHDFKTIDVLADPELRDGIKIYSSWPTIPQLYVNKEFIGGCDIVLELWQKNELQSLLKLEKAQTAPKIDVSKEALHAFKKAHSEGEDEFIRLSIATNFEHSLSFDQKKPDDFVLTFDGFQMVIDPYSALRASGLQIDFVDDHLEAGFSFKNPSEPPEVKDISVEELKALRDQNQDILLVDVRAKSEWEMANISFAKPLADIGEIQSLDKERPIVFHCHHGRRSMQVAEQWRSKGFKNLYNLTGGIDAWSKKIDSSVPTY